MAWHRRQGSAVGKSSFVILMARMYPPAPSAWCGCGVPRTNRSSITATEKTANIHDGDFFTPATWVDDEDGHLFSVMHRRTDHLRRREHLSR